MKALQKLISAAQARANLPAEAPTEQTRANLPAPTSHEELEEWAADLKRFAEELDDREFRMAHDEKDFAARQQRFEIVLEERSKELDAKGARVLEAEAAARDNPANLEVAKASIMNLHEYMHGRKGLSKAALGWIDRIKAALD